MPSYVTINEVSKLEDYADKFNNQIIGIEPGAGMMVKTEKLIEDYGLDSFEGE